MNWFILFATSLLGSTHDATSIAGIVHNEWIQRGGRRQFAPLELLGRFCRGVHEFCHTYRSAYNSGTSGLWHGRWPCIGIAPGRSVVVVAEHACHQSGDGVEENGSVCCIGHRDGHSFRLDIQCFVMMPIGWDDMRQDWGSADLMPQFAASSQAIAAKAALPYISMISLLRFTSFRIAICR